MQRYHFANKGPYSQSYGFFSSHVWIWELRHKEGWVLKNWCSPTVVLEETPESPLDSKEIKPVNPKENQPYSLEGLMLSWSSNTLATWCEEPTHWERPWCWKRLKTGGEEGDRGWGGWMASLTQWTWVWANSGRQWRTAKPGMLPWSAKSWTWLNDWIANLIHEGSTLMT